ncbi:MAG: hypothetical protein ACRD4S_13780 [Candidatus Acidiferrales bacterium]
MMRNFRIAIALLGLLAFVLGVAGANQEDKKTVFAFHDSVQVPGLVLPPGIYVFKLAGTDSHRNIVQIYNEDQSKLMTTVLAVPNSHLRPSGRIIATYAHAPTNEPPALEAWFYPGDSFGQQFVYPNSVASKLARLNTAKVPASGSEDAYPESESPSTSDSSSVNTPGLATTSYDSKASDPDATRSSIYAAPNRAADADASNPYEGSDPARNAASSNLPQTASDLPLLGLVGLLSIGAVLILRKMVHTLF